MLTSSAQTSPHNYFGLALIAYLEKPGPWCHIGAGLEGGVRGEGADDEANRNKISHHITLLFGERLKIISVDRVLVFIFPSLWR